MGTMMPPKAHPPMRHPPPTVHPPMRHPPMGHPPMGHPPMGHPPMGHPPMRHPPPTGQPPMGQPPMGAPLPAGASSTGPPPMGLPRSSGGPQMTSGRPLPPRLVAAQPVPFWGMQVDTPKASVQRRIYAADERVPEQAATMPPGQYAPLPHRPTPTTQPGSPQPGAQGGNNNRIDPAQIPRQDAQADAGRPWLTRTNLGQVPPPATSGFLVEDDGNASPHYMRLSLNQLIASEDHLKASSVPFGVVVQPLPQRVTSVGFAVRQLANLASRVSHLACPQPSPNSPISLISTPGWPTCRCLRVPCPLWTTETRARFGASAAARTSTLSSPSSMAVAPSSVTCVAWSTRPQASASASSTRIAAVGTTLSALSSAAVGLRPSRGARIVTSRRPDPATTYTTTRTPARLV